MLPSRLSIATASLSLGRDVPCALSVRLMGAPSLGGEVLCGLKGLEALEQSRSRQLGVGVGGDQDRGRA